MPARRLIKHNPLFMSDDELENAFVVRTTELEILADLVRDNQGAVNQHALVIGPRGMGKTMLMRRLALLVRSDEELSNHWYPIVAPEEIYDASTEGEIWLAILKSLAEQERRENGEFERWNERYLALLKEPDDQRLRAQTLRALTEFSHERARRLLVLIENLQMLLGEQFVKDSDWDLRKTLLNRSEFMLVLTATTRFKQIQQSAFAAYELFRELELKPLSTDECRRLWQAVSGQDLADQRIRPMEILTGGNPRLLAILATFAPERPLQELMENLVELIDDHTPFLKSNIDALPPQERRVFVNLAKLWEPSTARQVGERCRLNSNTTSAVIKSLVNRGIVVEQGKVGRGKLYQVAERIYCIYYLLRLSGSEADRMRAFVRFMAPLYGEPRLARSLAEAACDAEADSRSALIAAYMELFSAKGMAEMTRQSMLEFTPSEFFDLSEMRDFSLQREAKEVAGLFRKIFELQKKGHFEAAIKEWGDAVHRFHESKVPSVLGWVARMLVNKGAALERLKRFQEAFEVFDSVTTRYADTGYDFLFEPVIKAACGRSFCLIYLRRHEEAIQAADEIELFERRFAHSHSQETKPSEWAARSRVLKGHALASLGRIEEALQAYTKAGELFSERDNSKLPPAHWCALGISSAGENLVDFGQTSEALLLYETVEQNLSHNEKSLGDCFVVSVLVNKGTLLAEMGRNEEALRALDDAVEFSIRAADNVSIYYAALALVHKIMVLESLGRFEGFAEVLHHAVPLFTNTKDRNFLISLVGKRTALGLWDKPMKTLEFYSEILARIKDSRKETALELEAWALNGKALLCYSSCLGELNSAVVASERAVQLAPDNLQFRHTLALIYGLAARWGDAFLQIATLADDIDFVENNIEKMFGLLIDAAADGQAERAVKELAGTVVEGAMEPLMAALKELAGNTYRVPQEVDEVKRDVLAKIGARRQDLHGLRARLFAHDLRDEMSSY